jgi:hypothetical protein
MGLFSRLFGRRKKSSTESIVISPEYLPPELHYIIPLAQRHGSDARIHEFDPKLGRRVSHAEKLTPKDIDELRALYCEIREKDHGPAINRWHKDKEWRNCPNETSWPVYGLLCLFGQLSELGIEPFTDGKVRTMEFPVELDWSKLPPELRYLSGSAEVYGAYQFDDRIFEFLDRMTDDERTELIALNERMSGDWDAIDAWLKKYSMVEHKEAALVYFTMYLIGMAGDGGYLKPSEQPES